ncbi:MAG: zf-HC2 domain-containing protein [Pseudomonadota bacterium]|jgi:anti-sigma factor RsiW|nr:zf-HC2 domain-containing protein [Pseudomonadota bacterium]
MTRSHHTQQAAHAEAQQALPWYLNGTLPPDQALRVEAHLRECAECQSQLPAEQRIAEALKQAPVVDYSPSASLTAMMNRIDNSAAPTAVRRAARRPYPAARWWGPLAVAASLAALSVALWTQLEMSKPDAAPQDGYRTLSSAPMHAAPRLQVVFHDEITAAALRETLDSVHAHIVSGPSAGGLFVIELDRMDEASSTSELDAALAQLREDPAVRFAAAAPGNTP